MNVNTKALRELISAALDAEGLDFFCYDHFRPVKNQFTAGQNKTARIQILMEYAERNGLMEKLLEAIKAANSYQYNKFESSLEPETQTAIQALEQPEPSTASNIPTGVKVFISYAREDVVAVREIYLDLKKAGVQPWLDEEDLIPGQNWRTAISKAMKECRWFMAVMSSKSLSKRGYVQKELRIALDMLDEFPEGDIFIVPVRLDDCRPEHEKLANIHFADLFPSYKEGLKKILKALKGK
ncbi:TIR domain-containing protein [Desulfococcaceae bacterium HSG7]|nr:TIR domain-containing protein [Desulfococcaceae bacterium HSG7]